MVVSAEVIPINIEDEMRGSYLDYSMSVIIGRALPDVRDGLKPVHRRILYAMFREGLLSNKRYSKCAGVVGEVLKKYHPHGDMAVYDSLVRMAQEWNLRYPLVDGQGNFGSVDGDSAAAYRYTEAKLMKLAEELLADIDKETVDFTPNYDDTTEEPVVLPTKVPNLLINGSDGIAVGMATKIPPHNIREIIDGTIAVIETPDITIPQLMKHIPGPDFPTGASIYGGAGIKSAYETGRGIIQMRAKAMIEPIARGDRECIVITEIPYQVNKAKLIEHIATLVQDGKIEGISDLRDESDRDGMRIVVELKRGTVAGIILNQLYKYTSMQSSFGVIMLSIVSGQPKILTLKAMLERFVDHRREVVIRRTAYDLRKAQERAHILEGLKIAVENIDDVVALIKKSKSPEIAKTGLMQKYKLSDIQAQAILDLRLQRLTGLERDKIIQEYKDILEIIKDLKDILASDKRVTKIIVDELKDLRTKYGDERRTEIVAQQSDEMSVEDLIQEEDMVVTISHNGYIKRNPISIYRAQRRGGRGKTGMTTGDEDFVSTLFIATTHCTMLIFSTTGKVYWLKVHEIPQIGRTAKGKAISNLINMPNTESIAAIMTIREFTEGQNVVMATKQGVVKKTELMEYSRPRAGGIISITLDEGDAIVSVRLTDGKQDILLSTQQGQAIRFKEEEARPIGRTSRGVRGIALEKGDEVVSMETISQKCNILSVTQNGYGKRTDSEEYRVQGRGGSGIITIKTTDRNGPVVGTMVASDTDDIMLVTDGGKVIRQHAKDISIIGRNTQGVRLINLETGEHVVSFAKLVENDEDEANVPD